MRKGRNTHLLVDHLADLLRLHVLRNPPCTLAAVLPLLLNRLGDPVGVLLLQMLRLRVGKVMAGCNAQLLPADVRDTLVSAKAQEGIRSNPNLIAVSKLCKVACATA